VNFTLIDQNPIQAQSLFLVRFGFKNLFDSYRRNSGNMLRFFVTIVTLAVLIDAKFY